MRINQAGVVIAAGMIVSGLGAAAVLSLLVFDGWPAYSPYILFYSCTGCRLSSLDPGPAGRAHETWFPGGPGP